MRTPHTIFSLGEALCCVCVCVPHGCFPPVLAFILPLPLIHSTTSPFLSVAQEAFKIILQYLSPIVFFTRCAPVSTVFVQVSLLSRLMFCFLFRPSYFLLKMLEFFSLGTVY
ncbi:hypothetical protein AMECASPLE_033960 [Ameca splendens]|uniref:Uncharacterized protein n=1 Tax=Ameca splendens TaxID=208324 RepID=A0ABV1A370_9TELE